MSSLDPISDFFTRIRNANRIFAKSVIISYSKFKFSIAELLKKEGYIKDFEKLDNEGKPNILIKLKYSKGNEFVIHGIKQVSTQGKRIYVTKNDIPYVMGGYGLAIISTSKGVLSDKDARKNNTGGEVICNVW